MARFCKPWRVHFLCQVATAANMCEGRRSSIDAVITAEHAFYICVMHGVHDGGVFG